MSLIVTPAQANRINLAENMGEISLIPRNPDDDAVVEDSEQGTDELFGRSTANDRESEQYSETGDSSEGALAGFKSMMQQALDSAAAASAANPQEKKSHFQMKIIYPNEISTVQFSEDGEPISETNGPASNVPFPTAGSFTVPTTPAPAPVPGPAPAPPDGAPTPSDFPIDLRLK